MLPILTLLQSNATIGGAVDKAARGLSGMGVNMASYLNVTNPFTLLIGWFAVALLLLIQWIAEGIHSYGIAIILSVIIVRLSMLRLTRMQIRNMKVMQYLQPVQKELARYYPNRVDQNAKMMELYQEYKINPAAGCLPMLIQFPILFGVYRALYDPIFAGHTFLGIQLLFPLNVTAGRNMGHGPDIADIIDVTVAKLHLQHYIWNVPTNIPYAGGMFLYWPALALVVLYAASSFMMQRAMKKINQPHPEFAAEFKAEMKNKDDEPQQPDMAQQMARQMGFMNVMILVIAFIFSTGALIYFICQNILMTLEYTFLSRGAEPAFNAAEMKAFIRRPPPPSPQQGKAAPVKPPSRNGSEAQKPQGDETELSDDEPEGAGGPQRPRRKRRKR